MAVALIVVLQKHGAGQPKVGLLALRHATAGPGAGPLHRGHIEQAAYLHFCAHPPA